MADLKAADSGEVEVQNKDLRLGYHEIYIVQNARCVGVKEMLIVEGEAPYGVKVLFDNGAEIQCMYDYGHVPISVDDATATASRA